MNVTQEVWHDRQMARKKCAKGSSALQREAEFAKSMVWYMRHPKAGAAVRQRALETVTAQGMYAIEGLLAERKPLTGQEGRVQVEAATITAVRKAHAHVGWPQILLRWFLFQPRLWVVYFVAYFLLMDVALEDAHNLRRAAALLNPFCW